MWDDGIGSETHWCVFCVLGVCGLLFRCVLLLSLRRLSLCPPPPAKHAGARSTTRKRLREAWCSRYLEISKIRHPPYHILGNLKGQIAVAVYSDSRQSSSGPVSVTSRSCRFFERQPKFSGLQHCFAFHYFKSITVQLQLLNALKRSPADNQTDVSHSDFI